MRRYMNCFLLLSLLGLVAASPRPRDPWVLRCVLDGNPRMVVIALKPDIWASYDASECTLHKFWKGDVDFTGSVWNHLHGPQPVSRGDTLLHGPLEDRFFVTRSGIDVPCEVIWRGYRISNDTVALQYEVRAGAATFHLSEIPDAFVDDDAIRFERRFFVSEGPDQYTLGIRLRAEEDHHPVRLLHDGEVAEDAAGQQFYTALLPVGTEVVIDALFDNQEGGDR
ncbi:MAG: hypothetical protein KDA21_04355 [Phycisphaerales bacterium]|nr:hypothetical protein [Phycisphaerales bacterium]